MQLSSNVRNQAQEKGCVPLRRRNTIKERDLDNCTTYLSERGARSALSTYTTKFYLNQFYQSLPSDYTIVPIEIKLRDVL